MTTRNIKTAGYSHAKADARKDKRREEAEERNAQFQALPVKEKRKRNPNKHYA